MTIQRPSGTRPVRKDETDIPERGVHVESWLPERRSRRKPLFFIHGELGGSWLWERYLGYFAARGWEGHALNLRGHYWAETADMAELTFESYVDDACAALGRLAPSTLVGHGLGGLIALKAAERLPVAGIILISPALPAQLRPPVKPHQLREVPPVFRRDHLGWHLPPQHLRRVNPDLTLADAMRVRHMMGAESGRARQAMLTGVPVDLDALPPAPRLVIGGGVDAHYPAHDSARLAEWLEADYQPFGAHSHYGLVIGEETFQQVADTIRAFLEGHKL